MGMGKRVAEEQPPPRTRRALRAAEHGANWLVREGQPVLPR